MRFFIELVALSLIVLIGAAGCGVRGPLEPPQAAATGDSAKPGPKPAKKKGHDSFILDGLL